MLSKKVKISGGQLIGYRGFGSSSFSEKKVAIFTVFCSFFLCSSSVRVRVRVRVMVGVRVS